MAGPKTRPGLQKPQDRLHRDGERHDAQEKCRGEARKVAHLAGAEGEARVAGVALGEGVGRGRDAQGARMGGHVEAVREERHGAGEVARDDLAHHHERR